MAVTSSPLINLYSLRLNNDPITRCKLRSLSILGPGTLHVASRTDSYRFRYRRFKFSCSVLPNQLQKESRNNGKVDIFGKFHDVFSYSWWNLYDSNKEGDSRPMNPITVREALVRMWKLLGNEKWIMVVAFASLITAAVAEITMPTVLTASIFSARNGSATAFSRNIHLLGVLRLISGISSGLRSGFFAIANVILIKRLRETLYSALIFQDITFFETEEVGGLTSRLGSDCQRLSHVIGNEIHLIVRNFLQGTGALINLLCISWPLALSSLLVCFVVASILLVYCQYLKMAAKLTQDFSSCANEAAEETLSLIRTVQVYGTERKELGRYKHWLEKLAFISVRESVARGFVSMSFHTLHRSTQVFAVLLGGMSIMNGHVSTEQLTKYILYCEWLIYATWRVVDNVTSLIEAIGASEKVFQLMQLSPSDQFLSKGMKLQRLKGEVHFVDVSFHYPSRPTVPILQHFYLSVKPNEVVAVVGLSGSGKTTLVNLLLCLYKPINGQIYIDGFPLGELDMTWLKENIGYVGQKPELFHTDVKSNITYGCHRDIKLEDIECAAKLAYAHEFISSLPDGYETIVDDDLLSGGQKQRIAIARAILRDPVILVLDEATSALDLESEHYVKGILHALKNEDKSKRTVIFIAHRLSITQAADRIIVMDGGRIVEDNVGDVITNHQGKATGFLPLKVLLPAKAGGDMLKKGLGLMGNHRELLLKDGLYSQLIKQETDYLA